MHKVCGESSHMTMSYYAVLDGHAAATTAFLWQIKGYIGSSNFHSCHLLQFHICKVLITQ